MARNSNFESIASIHLKVIAHCANMLNQATGIKFLFGNLCSHVLYRNPCALSSREVRTVRKAIKPDKAPKLNFEKRLDVVIMGSPNAGKSVLLNNMVKCKLAATSRKRNTTQREILGVYNHRHVQLVFYDTPGYEFSPKSQVKKRRSIELSEVVVQVTEKADVVLLVVDAEKKLDERVMLNFAEMVKIALRKANKELVLVVNKVDMVNPKIQLLEITRKLVSIINGVKLGPGKEDEATMDTTTFMISGLRNDGVADLKNYLISRAEIKPWIVPASKGVTTLTIQERIEQIVLEAMLDHTHEELPYIADILCKKVEQYDVNRLKVYINITVDSSRQQRICVGHQGRTMLKIRQKTCENLEKILNQKVLVFFNILVRGKEDQSLQGMEIDPDDDLIETDESGIGAKNSEPRTARTSTL